MSILAKIRALPEGTKSRVIAKAHEIAGEKHAQVNGHGAEYTSACILWYDDDTWLKAWAFVQQQDLPPKRNRLDEVLLELAEADGHGVDAWALHEERVRLMRCGMKPTIKPFCFRCNSEDVVDFGALCKPCFQKVYG